MDGAVSRSDYQAKRLEFLRRVVDLAATRGLEIGAGDLPTVPATVGSCEFADLRSAEELARLWRLPADAVVPVNFLLNPATPVDQQIRRRFDYVVACHVLEHIPNPLGYLEELARVVKPDGGIVVFAIPDKRRTPDVGRQSTTTEHLLSDYYNDYRYPSVEHILEFSKHWISDVRTMSETSASDFYQWACKNHHSGTADVHCHVWTDAEFFDQIEWLLSIGFFWGQSIAAKQMTESGYNEFMIALRVDR